MDELLKEAALESFLFRPGEGDVPESSSSESGTAPPGGDLDETTQIDAAFFEDRGAAETIGETQRGDQEGPPPAWRDASDEKTIAADAQQGKHVARIISKMGSAPQLTLSEYEKELRRRHHAVHGNADWATLPSKKQKTEQAEDETAKLLSGATPLLEQTSAFPKGRVDVTAATDANVHDPHPSKLASIDYTFGGELFMTATRSGRICLFRIDGTENPMIDAIALKNLKIIQAAFLPQKQKALVIGSPQFQSIHLLDLESNRAERIFAQDPSELFHSFAAAPGSAELVAFVSRNGTVPIFSLKSRQWLARLQSNQPIEAATFVGDTLYTCSAGGKMKLWQMDTFRCVAEFTDSGTLHCSVLRVCPNQQYLATGSDSGVVNLYRASDCTASAVTQSPPTPFKTIFNLKTEITSISFHPTSQIMAIGSMHMASAMKLVHLPSGSVFANWPNQRLNKARVQSICFSPNGILMHVIDSPHKFGMLRTFWCRRGSALSRDALRSAWRTITQTATEGAPQTDASSYTTELSFTNADSAPFIPLFRTMTDSGASLVEGRIEQQFPQNLALRVYRVMLRVNVTDSIFYEAQRQGRLSFYATSFGEEATTVGIAAGLQTTDEAFLQYREQGFLAWRGFTPRQMADQCYGNRLESGRGRQMPVHYGSQELHVHTISSVLSTQIVHAVGAAFALKAEKKPNVAVAVFGDGAASEGDFHAALNFAATLELPVIFLCRNNGYAISTPTCEQYKPYCVAVRGPGYGIQTIRVDGGDPRAVYLATKEARRIAVEQNCPILIEALCYRGGHHSTSDDASRYRKQFEADQWQEREPIGRFLRFLNRNGWWSADQDDKLRQQLRQDAIDALDEAARIPKSPVGHLFTDVYDTVPWHLQEQHQALLDFLKHHPEQLPHDMPLK